MNYSWNDFFIISPVIFLILYTINHNYFKTKKRASDLNFEESIMNIFNRKGSFNFKDFNAISITRKDEDDEADYEYTEIIGYDHKGYYRTFRICCDVISHNEMVYQFNESVQNSEIELDIKVGAEWYVEINKNIYVISISKMTNKIIQFYFKGETKEQIYKLDDIIFIEENV